MKLGMLIFLLSLLIIQIAINPVTAAQWKEDLFVGIIFPISVVLLVLMVAAKDLRLAVTMAIGILFVIWMNT